MKTQRQVIEEITAQAMAVLRGQEDEDIQGLADAFQAAQDAIIAKVQAQFTGDTWTLDQMNNARQQQLFDAIRQDIIQLTAQLNAGTEDAAVDQFNGSRDWAAYMLDQGTPPNVTVAAPAITLNNIRAAVNTPFQGAMFSQRYGLVSDQMASDIQGALVQSMINGESMDDAASRIDDVMGGEEWGGYAGRSLNIARTEIMRSQNLGALATFEQNDDLMEDSPEWFATPDDRLCPWCMRRDGMTADQIEAASVPTRKVGKKSKPDPFGNSATMPLHPNCVLPGQIVSAPSVQGAVKASYSGLVVKMSFADGSNLTVTENHPVLTPEGWLAAKFFAKGDKVIRCTDLQGMMQAINPNYDHAPALVEQVFRAAKETSPVLARSVKVATEDFHGDGRSFDSEVDVVRAGSFLLDDGQAALSEHGHKGGFRSGSPFSALLSDTGAGAEFFPGALDAAHSIVSSGGEPQTVSLAGPGHACEHCGGPIAGLDASHQEAASDHTPRHTVSSRELLFRHTAFVDLDELVDVESYLYVGHVYDLQSGILPIYTCNGVLVHNCRCRWMPRLKSWKDLGLGDMPEGVDDDVRGMRDENGDWVEAPVQSFDDWKSSRMESFGFGAGADDGEGREGR